VRLLVMEQTWWRAQRRPDHPDARAGGAGLPEPPRRDEAVDALFRAQYPGLLRLAFCLVGQRGVAEDAVQDAFVSMYAHWPALRDPDAAPAYLRSAVINRCRSRMRERARDRGRAGMILVDRTEDALASSSEAIAVRHTEGSRLALAVWLLPRRQREVVTCRYYLELSVRETAELLGIGEGSVKRHAHRGVRALAAGLREETS
jgi:RNA polymerase sigma factor (sigma-70 family)